MLAEFARKRKLKTDSLKPIACSHPPAFTLTGGDKRGRPSLIQLIADLRFCDPPLPYPPPQVWEGRKAASAKVTPFR